MSRAFITTYRLRDGTSERLPLHAASSFGAIDQLMDRFGDQLARATARPQSQQESAMPNAPSGIVRADSAPPPGIPPGHIGPATIPNSGRVIWWTGRVAIGLRYQPAANTELGICAEQVQTALLGNRKAA